MPHLSFTPVAAAGSPDVDPVRGRGGSAGRRRARADTAAQGDAQTPERGLQRRRLPRPDPPVRTDRGDAGGTGLGTDTGGDHGGAAPGRLTLGGDGRTPAAGAVDGTGGSGAGVATSVRILGAGAFGFGLTLCGSGALCGGPAFGGGLAFRRSCSCRWDAFRRDAAWRSAARGAAAWCDSAWGAAARGAVAWRVSRGDAIRWGAEAEAVLDLWVRDFGSIGRAWIGEWAQAGGWADGTGTRAGGGAGDSALHIG